MDKENRDICVPREMVALLSDERLILRETGQAVTPFGGVAVFVAYLRQVAFVEKVRQCMPICWRSPNQIDPTVTFTAFLISVLVGAKRFAHANWLRGDRALHALLGIDHSLPFWAPITFQPTTRSAICSGASPWVTCSACSSR